MDLSKLSIYDNDILMMEENKILWANRLEDARETLQCILKYRKFYKLNFYKLCAPYYEHRYKRIQDLKQDLETMRKNRDIACETLKVAKHTLEKKFEESGQNVPEIINACCKDLISQCTLCEENILILNTNIEVEEQMCKEVIVENQFANIAKISKLKIKLMWERRALRLQEYIIAIDEILSQIE